MPDQTAHGVSYGRSRRSLHGLSHGLRERLLNILWAVSWVVSWALPWNAKRFMTRPMGCVMAC